MGYLVIVGHNCNVQVDRREYAVGEPIYIVLTNLGPESLYLGSWHVVHENGNVVFRLEPAQIMIQPNTSYTVVWFQWDNEGKQVSKGKYYVVWYPRINGQLINCRSDYFEII